MLKIFLLLILLFSFSHAKEHFDVGVVYWSSTIEGQRIMREGLLAEKERINKNAEKKINLIEYFGGDGSEGVKNQVEKFEKLIDQNVDAIIVQPMDSSALRHTLEKANRKQIPVITYDGYIFGKGRVESYIVSDNFMLGYYDGEYIASLYDNNTKIKTIILDYPYQQNAIHRVDGFITALEENKQSYEILARYISVEPEGAKRAAKSILQEFPKKGSIDVVFANNDGGSLETVKALKEAGRDEIIFATIDGDPVSVENIKKGNLTVVDTAQFCAPLGEEAIKQTYNLLIGKKVPAKVTLPVFPITKETMKLYPGWSGPIPEQFKKSWESVKSDMWDNSYKYDWR